jgi:hypothetical protein
VTSSRSGARDIAARSVRHIRTEPQ